VTALTTRERSLIGAIAVLAVVAGVLHYAGAPDLTAFAVAGVALAGMAWMVSFATEQVGERFGPAITGVMQSTLGNLPEFFVVVFALNAGEVVVAQFSILGSIFANALLVLGLVIVAGSRQSKDGVMRFHPRLPQDTATLFLVALFIIVLVALAAATHDPSARHIRGISTITAVLLLGVYLAWLYGYLRNATGEQSDAVPRIPIGVSIALLAVAGVGAAFVSDWFIAALDPAIDKLGLSKEFAGLVIVAIAGNAVENVVGITLAAKGEADLAISVVKNSVAQVAAFLFPALVLVSLLLSSSLTFAMPPLFVGALFLTAILIWQVSGDGEAAEFEGWALVATFAVLATFTLYE
jgi:Ca2+:H+ antiporter